MKKLIISCILALFTTTAISENLINTQTNSWKSVPITVNEEKHTYSLDKGYLLPEGDYYYTYSGYRCLKSKINDASAEPVIYNDTNTEGQPIYCYPEK